VRDLVLLHSLLTDRSAFERVRGDLGTDFRLYIPDLPGYGATPSRGESTIAGYADRIAPGIPKGAALLGNGFGGFIAVMVAIRHGERLGALVAAPALAGFPPPAREPFRAMAGKVRTGGMATVLDAAISRMFPAAFIAAHPDIVAERKAALAEADPQAFARACLALAELDLAPSLARIQCRTLVLAGELDQTIPASLARELAAGIRGAKFQELKSCGHCPQIEDPRAFVAAVRQFLS
jgi:3-oxoadipate enol-lactonase